MQRLLGQYKLSSINSSRFLGHPLIFLGAERHCESKVCRPRHDPITIQVVIPHLSIQIWRLTLDNRICHSQFYINRKNSCFQYYQEMEKEIDTLSRYKRKIENTNNRLESELEETKKLMASRDQVSGAFLYSSILFKYSNTVSWKNWWHLWANGEREYHLSCSPCLSICLPEEHKNDSARSAGFCRCGTN